MDESNQGAPCGAQMPAVCPYCRMPLETVSWTTAAAPGGMQLISFFHQDPECMSVLNCQLMPAPRRLIMPSGGIH